MHGTQNKPDYEGWRDLTVEIVGDEPPIESRKSEEEQSTPDYKAWGALELRNMKVEVRWASPVKLVETFRRWFTGHERETLLAITLCVVMWLADHWIPQTLMIAVFGVLWRMENNRAPPSEEEEDR